MERSFHIVDQAGSRYNGTQAIERAAHVLVRVVESERPLAVGELAHTTGLPKSTTSRLVSALERQGLVQRAGGLQPGPVLLRFAQRGLGTTLVELADAALERLAEESGETINLAVPTPLGVEHLAQRDSRHFVGVTNWVGVRVPHHVTANGKVFLAFGAAPAAGHANLKMELETVRRRGYATAVDELEQGLSAVAAPVHGAGGEVVAALSISGPTARLTRRRLERLARPLREEAGNVSQRLGGSPP
jgi:IclR family transcriptional regulator, acetate operon repressor